MRQGKVASTPYAYRTCHMSIGACRVGKIEWQTPCSVLASMVRRDFADGIKGTMVSWQCVLLHLVSLSDL